MSTCCLDFEYGAFAREVQTTALAFQGIEASVIRETDFPRKDFHAMNKNLAAASTAVNKFQSDKSLTEFVTNWLRNRRTCSQIRASEVTSTVRSEECFGQRFEAHVDGNNCVLFFGKPDFRSTQSVGTILEISPQPRTPFRHPAIS